VWTHFLTEGTNPTNGPELASKRDWNDLFDSETAVFASEAGMVKPGDAGDDDDGTPFSLLMTERSAERSGRSAEDQEEEDVSTLLRLLKAVLEERECGI